MAWRQRRSISGRLSLAAIAMAGMVWVWSQSWGQVLLTALAVLVVGGGMAYVLAARRRRGQRRYRLATLQGLLELSPRQFKDEVARLLGALGFTGVQVCGAPSDLQADIVATDPDGLTAIVQCKRYAPGRTIGSPVLQSFIGMARVHHGCDRALFVTTASFTGPACRLADEHDIELIDGGDLVELFAQQSRVPA